MTQMQRICLEINGRCIFANDGEFLYKRKETTWLNQYMSAFTRFQIITGVQYTYKAATEPEVRSAHKISTRPDPTFAPTRRPGGSGRAEVPSYKFLLFT